MTDPFAIASSAGIVVLAIVAALMVAGTCRNRDRAVRIVLWLGLLVPLWVSTDSSDVANVGSEVGPMAAIRGAIPALCILVGAAMRRERWQRFELTEGLVVGFLTVCALSAFWSASPPATLLKMLVLAFQFILAGMLVRSYPTVRDALNGLATVGLLLLVAVALEAAFAPSTAFQASGNSSPRLQGVYPYIHPNSLGYLAGVTAVLLIAGMGPAKVTRHLWLRAPATVAALAILLATQTRYAIVMILIVFAVVAVRVWRTVMSPEKSLVLFTGGMFTLGVTILAVALNAGAIGAAFSRGQSADVLVTLTGRTDIWSRAWALWANRPVQGWGYYSGHRILLSSLPGTDAQLSNIDNMWLETLVDTGLLGALILVALVISGLVRILRRTDGDQRAQVALAGVAIFGVVASFLNPSIQTNGYPGILFGMVLLLGAHPMRMARSVVEPRHGEAGAAISPWTGRIVAS